MEQKLGWIYYSLKGYWRGLGAVKKLSSAAKVSDAVALEWLKRQAMWQAYLPAMKYITMPKFDVSSAQPTRPQII